MSVRSRLYHATTREAPPDLLRLLREVDPSAELVYMGFGRWILGGVRNDGGLYLRAGRMAERARDVLDRHVVRNKVHASSATDWRSIRRLWFARLAMQGFRSVAEYQMRRPFWDPDTRVVHEFRMMDWLYRHTRDQELETAIDARRVQGLEDARKDLSDPERGNAAWQYAFTRTHPVTRVDDPTKPGVRSSARTLVRTA